MNVVKRGWLDAFDLSWRAFKGKLCDAPLLEVGLFFNREALLSEGNWGEDADEIELTLLNIFNLKKLREIGLLFSSYLFTGYLTQTCNDLISAFG